MKNPANNTFFAVGSALGKPLGWILRKEQPVINWLTNKGLSVSFAKRLMTIVNLFIIVSILFAMFPMWITLVTLIFAVLAFIGIDIDVESPKEPEWKLGMGGFGLYDEHDIRVDVGDNED